MRAIKITTRNEVSEANFEQPLFKTIGKAVGGYIEIVRLQALGDPYRMVVNEEGAVMGLPLNMLASILYGDAIFGNAVIMKEGYDDDGEPDIVGLEENEIENVLSMLECIEVM